MIMTHDEAIEAARQAIRDHGLEAIRIDVTPDWTVDAVWEGGGFSVPVRVWDEDGAEDESHDFHAALAAAMESE